MKKKNRFAFTCPHEHFLTETEMNTNKFHRSKTKRNNLNNFTPNFFRSYDFSFRSETCMPRTSTGGDDLAVRRTWQTEWLAWRTPDGVARVCASDQWFACVRRRDGLEKGEKRRLAAHGEGKGEEVKN